MSSSTGQAFLFGKLPAHGDFVARGLADPAREVWDDWASAAIQNLRSSTDEFDSVHGSIPPWRFIAGPSALGTRWRIGALAPSVDGAGRRFVVVAGIEGCSAARAAVCGLTIAGAVEDVLYRAIAEQLQADQVMAALGEALEYLVDEAAAADALAATLEGPGAWWTAGIDARAGALPPQDIFAKPRDSLRREHTA